MASLGQELKHKREERGLSLKDIAGQTKINVRLLQALEEDRLDTLPEPFFRKGVVRAYVRTVRGDEKYFLRRLTEATGAADVPAEREEPASAAVAPDEGAPRRRGARAGLILIALLAVAAVAAVIYLRRHPHPAPAGRIRAAAPAVSAPERPPATPAVPQPALRLEMSFNADTWLQISADGMNVLHGILPPGRTIELTAEKEFVLQIGNAGGFSFKLNGKPGKTFGPLGAVRTDIRITPQNVAEFQESPAPAGAPR